MQSVPWVPSVCWLPARIGHGRDHEGHAVRRESQPVTWSATQPDGTPVTSAVTIDKAEVGTADQLPSGATLQPGQTYFYVALYPTFVYSNDPQTPVPMPVTPATLTTPTGTVTGIPAAASSFTVDGAWYFPLHGSVSAVTLQVASFTKVLGNERGDFGTWTFDPTPITFVTTHVTAPPVSGNSSGTPGSGGGGSTANASTAAGTPVGLTIGAGAAGLLALGAAAAGAVTIRRRRAFARADREGRVVLSGPPALAAGAVAWPEPGFHLVRQRIVVKLLGPLVVDGTKRTITHGPVLEIITFLALHPGQSFTSVQLRESIWGLGRKPIASQTFRKYMVELRKAFGTGVVVTDVYRYELTDSVTSDWDLFRACLDADDELAGQEDALALVRGPVLHGCFDGRKNSPFSWAYERPIASRMQIVGRRQMTWPWPISTSANRAEPARRSARASSARRPISGCGRSICRSGQPLAGRERSDDGSTQAGRLWPPSPDDVVALEREAQGLGWERLRRNEQVCLGRWHEHDHAAKGVD